MGDVAVIGLAVMGANLALNLADHGFKVVVFNRTTARVDELVRGAGRGKTVIGVHTLEDVVRSLARPRRIIIMIRAGAAVDEQLKQLAPLLDAGDIVVDGGNSNFADTTRRVREMRERGLLFVGMGVSGGEEGARNGPSLMPGGAQEAWEPLRPMLQRIAAHVDDDVPCCEWVGPEGAGHFVKMVHNGIEYADMQLIGETFDILQRVVHLSIDEIADVFDEWNRGELNSYLVEITSAVLRKREPGSNARVVDTIVDVAGQKGTGKWTVSESLEVGSPITVIGEAVMARFLSGLREQRARAAVLLPGPSSSEPVGDRAVFIEYVRQALYAAKLVSYAQGFMMIRRAANENKWPINYGGVALMWRGGCIIRSRFLGDIKMAFARNPALECLLLDSFFATALKRAQEAWRHVMVAAVRYGVPTPGLSAALAFYDGYRQARSPAFLIQAQRDFFGAHTYERIDKAGTFHTDWTGRGGTTTSTTYNA